MNVPKEDRVNQNFQIDSSKKQTGRFQPRRINHPKFKNVNSKKALDELAEKEIGEYIFRPSSKGTNNITLTWKFYN
jgi:transcription elongation factor SPT6